MILRFFRIEVGDEGAEEELNRFLASHRIVAVERQFFAHQGVAVWAICVTAEAQVGRRPVAGQEKARVDWKEVLSPEQFAVYAELRTLRKELAEAEGVAVYNVMTNAQLAEIVRRRVVEPEALRAIPGLGEARVAKYGERFVARMQELAEQLDAMAPAGDGAPPAEADTGAKSAGASAAEPSDESGQRG